MRYALTTLIVLAALAMIAASCALNFDYWSAQGQTARESFILGAVSVAVDLMKSALPVFIVMALRALRIIYANVAACAFVLFVAASLISSIGFINKTRGANVSSHEALSARYRLVRQELAELDKQLTRVPAAAPVATIEARIKSLQQNWRWTSTKQCSNATASASRTFCTNYFATREKLGVAVATGRLAARRAELRSEVTQLQQIGATQIADPHAYLLARFVPGLDHSDAKLGLMLFFAVFIEVGAALGLYLATCHGWVTAHARRKELTDILGTRQSRSQPVTPLTALNHRSGVAIDLQPETRPFALKPPRQPKPTGA
jgi:hypothetical protein